VVSGTGIIARYGRVAAMAERAAEYVRMSTEHQRYSTENQSDVIRQYAAHRGIEIVRTYADEGKSGLRLKGRDALTRLIADVTTGQADFTTILVYDVSRWGRFQDPDEGGHYEFICKKAGIKVQYCAEQFDNDGSPASTIVKGVKRAMAGEYSRELSAKVFAGQCRLIELGFRQGGPPGFGLRRCLVDQSSNVKGELARGEHKSIQTDRVILAPGPAQEIDTVRWIYRAFVEDGKIEREIAASLNERGILTDLGRAWTRGTVHQVLINEKYIGNNVWNRTSFKLQKQHVRNSPESWRRANGAFTPIVDRSQFEAARAIIEERSRRLTNDELLDLLRRLLQENGYLSGLLINESETDASSSTYRARFGSLLRAYQLIGFTPLRDYGYIEVNRRLRRLHPEVLATIVAGIARSGATAVFDEVTDLLTVNGEFALSLVVVRCRHTAAGSLRWQIRLDTGLLPDLTLAVRMDGLNMQPLDYYLLPRRDMTLPQLRLAHDNGVSLDSYRFDTLDALYELTARVHLLEVA
jgi:DNA invertase Pin-like site-specific DNA recombinase